MSVKRFLLLLFSFTMLLSFGIAEGIGDPILLKLTFEPTSIEQVFSLPNGSFLIDYYTLNTSEFWHNMGRDDVLNHITEVVDTNGKSLWYFRDSGDVLPEDTENHLFQYMVFSDSIIREFYTDVSMGSYYRKIWDLDGKIIENNIDSIAQREEDVHYVMSMYPYILIVWSQGDSKKNAQVINCADKTSIELDYCYGSRATLVTDYDFYLFYDAQGIIKLIHYKGDTKQIQYYATNLDAVPGKLLCYDSTLYILVEKYQDNELGYSLFSCPRPSETCDSLSFELIDNYSINTGLVVDDFFIMDDIIQCFIGDSYDNFYIGHFDDGKILIDVSLGRDIRYYGNKAGLIRFLISDKPGNEKWLVTVSEKNYQDFLMYFDQAQ